MNPKLHTSAPLALNPFCSGDLTACEYQFGPLDQLAHIIHNFILVGVIIPLFLYPTTL